MPGLENDEDFSAYRLLILSDLRELKADLKEVTTCLQSVKSDIIAMKIRGGMNTALIAAIVGAVPGLLTAFVMWWRG